MAVAAQQTASGFRDTPRNREAPRIFLLRRNGAAHIAFQQRAGRRLHPKRRHQVFEHRTRPRLQNRLTFVLNMRTIEVEPAFLRDLTFRNACEYRGARFGGKQIIVMFTGRAFRSVKTNRNQLARLIVNQREIHSRCQFVGIARDSLQCRRCLCCDFPARGKRFAKKFARTIFRGSFMDRIFALAIQRFEDF